MKENLPSCVLLAFFMVSSKVPSFTFGTATWHSLTQHSSHSSFVANIILSVHVPGISPGMKRTRPNLATASLTQLWYRTYLAEEPVKQPGLSFAACRSPCWSYSHISADSCRKINQGKSNEMLPRQTQSRSPELDNKPPHCPQHNICHLQRSVSIVISVSGYMDNNFIVLPCKYPSYFTFDGGPHLNL